MQQENALWSIAYDIFQLTSACHTTGMQPWQTWAWLCTLIALLIMGEDRVSSTLLSVPFWSKPDSVAVGLLSLHIMHHVIIKVHFTTTA